jgi:hypothetical protein
MSFEKPPSLDNFQEILPEGKNDITPRQKRVRILAVIVGILLLLLAGVNLWKSDLTSELRGAGIVKGVVVDGKGQPFAGNIFVTGTNLAARTNPDGSFELKNIPTGRQLIVVADSQSGREIPVIIVAGQTTEMGTVTFESTATP